MYQYTAPIPNTFQSVVRPITYQLLRQLMCENMLPKIKRIDYNDAISRSKLNGSVLCNKAARLKCEEFISIQANTEYRTNNDHWVRTWDRHRIPVWMDKAHELYVTPLYDEMKVTLTIQVVTTSLSKLRQWVDQVRMIQRRGRQRVNHQLEYAMPFPRMAYEWFCDMYDLTDDHESVTEMIKQHGANALDVISSGTHYEIVVSEYQANAKGTMFQTGPTIEKLINGSYTGTMEYVLEYNKPIAMLFQYPIMVHQKTIPREYLPIPNCIPDLYWVENPMDIVGFEPSKRAIECLRVPNFDREVIEKYPPWYTPIVTVLASIDEEHPLELFNLRQLGDVYITEPILEVISRYYIDEVVLHRRSPFMLTLHRDGDLLHTNYLQLDSELNVSLTRPITLDGIYRVSLCILTNTSALPMTSYRGLATNDDALTSYVRAVNSMPVTNRMGRASKSHGINSTVIESDFKTGHYLHHFSPLVCIKKTVLEKDNRNEWNYVSETVLARGTSLEHTHTKTVQTLSVKVGKSGNPTERTPKDTCSPNVNRGNVLARPRANGDD